MSYDLENDDYCGYGSIYDKYQEEYEEMLLQRHINERTEKDAFKSIPGHGYNAPAYKKGIDNIKILELYRKGYSLRKIAKEFSCSPSTIRLRLQALIRTPGGP